MRITRRSRDDRGQHGSAAIEEVMALAVILPVVAAATVLGMRMFRLFFEGAAVGVGWPFP